MSRSSSNCECLFIGTAARRHANGTGNRSLLHLTTTNNSNMIALRYSCI